MDGVAADLVRRVVPAPIDPLRSERRAVYVSGSSRSGTTWVAQTVARALRARLVFEPLHHRGPIPAVPHFRPRGAAEPELRRGIRRALRGSLRDERIDRFRGPRVATRRVVKDIRPGLLPVVTEVAPKLPVVLLVRHPLAVATSRVEVAERDEDWWDLPGALAELKDLAGADGDGAGLGALARTACDAIEAVDSPLAAHVAVWCVENRLALDEFPRDRGAVVRYGDVVVDPARWFAPIAEVFGCPMPSSADLAKPSKTAFRERTNDDRLGGWRAGLDPGLAAELLEITASFGLDHLFGSDPRVPLPPLDSSLGSPG